MRALFLAGCLLVLVGCAREDSPRLHAEDIALNNRGVALMGYFDYSGAHEVFQKLVEQRPDWAEAKVNLAIATLNRQQEGDEHQALALLGEVLKQHPDHLRAQYVSGLLYLYIGETERSLGFFRGVAEADPGDAYAAYYVGQSLLQEGKLEQALDWYKAAIENDPYLRSAYYGAALVLRRLKRSDEARQMLQDYQRFENNPRARLAEFKYTRMGPKAEALAVGVVAPDTTALPAGDLFAPPEDLLALPAAPPPHYMTTADIDGDGDQDLFLTSPAGPSVVAAGENGRYAQDESHPLAQTAGVVAALWGDVDNDGRIDVYLCRHGPNQLWRQDATGQWQDVTAPSGTANGSGQCADAALFDADHDGDLDIFVVNEDQPNELFNNNLDGNFMPLAREQGLAGPGQGGRSIVTTDIDHDRDVDLIVIRREPPHEVFLNDRLWQYRPASGFEAAAKSDISAAVAGDIDADGLTDLITLDGKGALFLWRREGDAWKAAEIVRDETRAGEGSLVLQDFSGNGTLDLLWQYPGGFSVYETGGAPPWTIRFVDDTSLISLLPVLEQPVEGPSIFTARDDNGRIRLERRRPGDGRHSFTAFALTGKEDAGESMRSNASGIGTQIALRNGSRWTVSDTFDKHSAPGQSLQPLSLGLGGRTAADYVAINWSDGVFQTELEVESGLIRISETQRQLSSCPVLFAWDGARFGFVSDVLGVGGLGAFVSPGQYATPRPWEFFLLPEGLLQPKAGAYQLKLAEPMEENAYVDHVRLHVYDIPGEWSMTLDERLAVLGPTPTGTPIFYRQEISPSRAINDRGEDVTGTVLANDHRAAPVGELDRRFIGRLERPHVLILEFEQPLDPSADWVLVIDGWVEYPYSQTTFAAWQAGVGYSAPSLAARDGEDRWHQVYERFGYPAGMPRQMALPLEALPADTRALRLSTEREVYWDRVRLVRREPLDEKRVTSLDASRVRLMKTGFPRRTTLAQRVPHYDYEDRSPYWDTKYPAGYYTRLGNVTPLLSEADDALAVFGPGEEIHMEFPAVAEPSEPESRRLFVLEVHGYAKDMDMLTRDGETVEPLPRQVSADAASPDYLSRRDSLHERYNIRFQAGK